MTPREEFHKFIDELNDDLANMAKPAFHVAIEELEVEWVRPALRRMRALRACVRDPRVPASDTHKPTTALPSAQR
jgi:hypothetical protein